MVWKLTDSSKGKGVRRGEKNFTPFAIAAIKLQSHLPSLSKIVIVGAELHLGIK